MPYDNNYNIVYPDHSKRVLRMHEIVAELRTMVDAMTDEYSAMPARNAFDDMLSSIDDLSCIETYIATANETEERELSEWREATKAEARREFLEGR